MADIKKKLKQPFDFAIEKWNRFHRLFSLKRKIQILFGVLLFALLVYHEHHLGIEIATLFGIFGCIVGLGLLEAFYRILDRLTIQFFHPVWELLVFLIFFLSLYLSTFLEHESGIIFLFIFLFLFLFFRFLKLRIYYIILIIAMLLTSSIFLSFQVIQKIEILANYLIFNSRVGKEEISLENWNFDESKSTWSNPEIPLEFVLPKEMTFFKPSNLSMKDKTGTGQIAGVIASSSKDPNRYPCIRIFYLPSFVIETEFDMVREMRSYLDFLVNQGEIEEIKDLGDLEFKEKNLPGRFWSFYDVMRPRIARTGFYLYPLGNGARLILHITENEVKTSVHEESILAILLSLKSQ